MNWKRRYATLKRVGVSQVAMARAWIALDGDTRIQRGISICPGGLVIDVGAYKGEFSALVQSEFDAEVIAIEPIPEFARALEQRFAGYPTVTVLPVALGQRTGRICLRVAADGSSAWALGDREVEVPLLDVAEVLEGRHVALLKMNAEGAEFDVLGRLLETGRIQQIEMILVQFHKFVPEARARRKSIRRGLGATHRCAVNVPWVWELWRRM